MVYENRFKISGNWRLKTHRMHRKKLNDFHKNRERKGLADQSVRKDALSKIAQKMKHNILLVKI